MARLQGRKDMRSGQKNSKAVTEDVALGLSASGGAAKQRHQESKETSRQDSQAIPVQRNLKSHTNTFTATGDIDELQIHFHALLDPAFGNAEGMHIVFGGVLGEWLKGPFIPLNCIRECEGYIYLHGVIYLPTSFKKGELQVPYKYVKILDNNQVIFEVISRPKVDSSVQGYLNRKLIIRSNDWQGRYAKYDSIVSPSAESWWNSLKKSFFRYLTREAANKVDIEEFKLCLRAFLPKLPFSFNPADAVIDSYITVVGELYRMSFVLSGNYSLKRFDSFLSHEKLEIFMSIFENEINENYNLVTKGGHIEQLTHALLSTITMASILVFSNDSYIPWKEYLKLVESFSLTRLFESGVTLHNIRDILSKQLHRPIMIEKIASWLSTVLTKVLEQHTVKTSTSAWWSISSLIAILYDMVEEEQKFSDVEKLLAKASLSEKEKDIAEVEAALYYAPRLEGIILSKFCLQNYGVFFKIRSLDVVKLLQTMEKLVVNKRWFLSPEISEVEVVLVLLKSKIECHPIDIERIQTGINTTLRTMASLLKSIDCFKHMSVFGELLGILEIFVGKVKEAALESMHVFQSIFEAFEKGIEDIM